MGYQSADKKIAKLWVSNLFDISGARLKVRVQTKTADYSVLNTDTGTIFTNYGDGDAINYTLPVHPETGLCYLFVNAVNYGMTITAGTADTLIAYADAEADSVDFDQTSHMVAQAFFVFADGTNWNALALTKGTLGVNT